MQKAEAILMKDMPWIPIMYYGKSHLISPKIKGFEHEHARRLPDAVPVEDAVS